MRSGGVILLIREAELRDFTVICDLMKNELGYPDLDEEEAVTRLNYFKSSDDQPQTGGFRCVAQRGLPIREIGVIDANPVKT